MTTLPRRCTGQPSRTGEMPRRTASPTIPTRLVAPSLVKMREMQVCTVHRDKNTPLAMPDDESPPATKAAILTSVSVSTSPPQTIRPSAARAGRARRDLMRRSEAEPRPAGYPTGPIGERSAVYRAASRRRADSPGRSAHRGGSPGMADYQDATDYRVTTINP
jgi:hypothetical protein